MRKGCQSEKKSHCGSDMYSMLIDKRSRVRNVHARVRGEGDRRKKRERKENVGDLTGIMVGCRPYLLGLG